MNIRTTFASLVLTFSVAIAPASAQVAVFDYPNWMQNSLTQANSYTSAINSARQIEQNIQQIQNEVNQLKTFQTNLGSRSWLWGQIQTQISSLNSLLAKDNTFAASSTALNNTFTNQFNYHTPADFDALYSTWNANTQSAVITAASAAKLNVADVNGAEQVQLTNRTSLANATGVHDTLQAVGKIADQQVEQLTKISQLDAIRTSMEAQYYATEIAHQNEDHATSAALNQWLANSGASAQSLQTLHF
jgi:P-type conjugative transfer protein TrbJ